MADAVFKPGVQAVVLTITAATCLGAARVATISDGCCTDYSEADGNAYAPKEYIPLVSLKSIKKTIQTSVLCLVRSHASNEARLTPAVNC